MVAGNILNESSTTQGIRVHGASSLAHQKSENPLGRKKLARLGSHVIGG